MRHSIYISLIFFLFGCGQGKPVKYDYNDFHGEAGQKYWSLSSFPLIINVPIELESFKDSIQIAGERWSEALGFEAFVFRYGIPNHQYSSVKDSLTDSFFGIFGQELWEVVDSKGAEIENSVLAVTTLSSIQGEIIHADIFLNFDTYSFGNAEDSIGGPQLGAIDMESVMVHELGHYLGLEHVPVPDDPASVMKASLRRGESRRGLSDQDTERVRMLYQSL